MSIEYYAFALFLAGLICIIAILCKLLFADVKRQQKLLDEKETKLLHLYQTVESIMEEFSDQVKAATEENREYENRMSRLAASIASQPVGYPQRTHAEPVEIIRAESEVKMRAEPMEIAQSEATEKAPVESIEKTLIRSVEKAQAEPAEITQAESEETARDETNMLLQAGNADSNKYPIRDSNRLRAANEALARAKRLVKTDSPASPAKNNVVTIKGDRARPFTRFIDDAAKRKTPPDPKMPDVQTRNERVIALVKEGKTDAQIASEAGITQNEVKLIKFTYFFDSNSKVIG